MANRRPRPPRPPPRRRRRRRRRVVAVAVSHLLVVQNIHHPNKSCPYEEINYK